MAGPTKWTRVLDFIELRGPMTPAELSRRMGLRQKGLAATLATLVDDGVLYDDAGRFRYRDCRPTIHKAVQDLPARRRRDWRGDVVAGAMREASEPLRDADGYVALHDVKTGLQGRRRSL